MSDKINRLLYILAVFLMVLPIVSCGSGGSETAATGTTGTLGLSLTDATSDQYQAIYVTINEIQVKQGTDEEEAGWMTILTPGKTFDLLTLVNGVRTDLGLAELEAGQYGQMRLILGELPEAPETNLLGNSHPYANYLIDSADQEIELKVPSGYQTGIKIVHGFTIIANGATELILDFDALKSVVQAGKSGKWLLKPTIKVLETVDNSVGGIVTTDGVDLDPVEGALVSAQIDDATALDSKNAVSIESATISDIEGTYFMYLVPDTYNIVATKDGYLPGCVQVQAEFFEPYIADFSLIPVVESGTISGLVSGLATAEDSVLLSIRQSVDCGTGTKVMIEVGSLNVANDTAFSIALPPDSYQIVVSTETADSIKFDPVGVKDTDDTLLDITYVIP